MSLNEGQFRQLIVEPALHKINLHSPAAVELVMNTAKQESALTYLKQLGQGPALGLFQMEPFTHDDIWNCFLRYKDPLANDLKTLAGFTADEFQSFPNANNLVGNLWYAAAMCRVHYFRRPEPLPTGPGAR